MSLLTTQVTINIFFPTMSCVNFHLINIENKKSPLQAKNSRKWLKIADISFEQTEGLCIWMVIGQEVSWLLPWRNLNSATVLLESSHSLQRPWWEGGQGGLGGSAPLGRRETWGEGGNRRGQHLLVKWGGGVRSPKSRLGLWKGTLLAATLSRMSQNQALPNQCGSTWGLYPWNTWLRAQQHYKTFLTFSSNNTAMHFISFFIYIF